MEMNTPRDEYASALKKGIAEFRELSARGLDPYPPVLDKIISGEKPNSGADLPITDIPLERVIGTVTEGRTVSFSRSFYPILPEDTEFGAKWISLAGHHLNEGIQDAIKCYEYLGDFYVLEGNKRVSVLKCFGAAAITAEVRRIMPDMSDDPRIAAYKEFLDFYESSGLYSLKYTKPGEYPRLLAYIGKAPGEKWPEDFRRAFSSAYAKFNSAYSGQAETPEALLTWLEAHSYKELCDISLDKLKLSLNQMTSDVNASEKSVGELPKEAHKNVIRSIIAPDRQHISVAFVHQRDPETSLWTSAHDTGAKYLQAELHDKVTVRSYFNADTQENAEKFIELAVSEGADAVFTTTPALLRATLKIAVKYPRVRFFNCSPSVPFASVRGYYFRGYEGKFITGAIAGAMAKDGRIGYIASYPIVGEPAMINAFALGASMTAPDAKIYLKWSCLPGDAITELLDNGITVISNHDAPSLDWEYMKYGDFGLFISDGDELKPLASPCWLWGSFYEKAVHAMMTGAIDEGKGVNDAVNYILGMDSGVINVSITDKVPDGIKYLANLLRKELTAGRLDIFSRRVSSTDGELISSESMKLSVKELMQMDKLAGNVIGHIPEFEELKRISQPLVRLIGIHKDRIPPEIEAQE